jgi:hypothetical protein
MTNDTVRTSRDWLASAHASAPAWWVPKVAIVAALFAPVSVRSVVWTIALMWLGTACILNARRCGRTHCRYTGPYYLAMIAPVLSFASGLIAVGFYGWVVLCILVLGGSWIIWWATERAWGKFS